ncbi:MAG: hypothetical protein EAY75_13535 [Bacteroidetes bacterium]|nr:MAG: hypothetical protein EAY75_13535 [Bacteroidota bacterium]
MVDGFVGWYLLNLFFVGENGYISTVNINGVAPRCGGSSCLQHIAQRVKAQHCHWANVFCFM